MLRSDLAALDLPDHPGVYFFRDERKKILYVGKATSLRDRVKSYFAHDLEKTRSSAIRTMVETASTITYETTDTVLEALILEANLIKKHQPPYNVMEKDNKSYNYLVITKEPFPRVLVVRGRELFQTWSESDIRDLFGPYPQGGALKEAVKLVRKIFPFRDSCTPEIGKPCFNKQIGLCPGVCSGDMSEHDYRHTIANIRELFSGHMRSLSRRLEKEMKDAAQSEDFETAEERRRQVYALKHIRDVSLIKDEYRYAAGGSVRIEAFDVAHTHGSETVGVMVVVEGGEAQKAGYRMFKIHRVDNNDIAALQEVLERRLAHSEWGMPRIIAVDGGNTHKRAAERILKKAGVSIPVVAVVKDEHHKPRDILGDQQVIRAHESDILLANSEAHRFAITWHRKRLRAAR